MKVDNIIGKSFEQNCGDILIVISSTDKPRYYNCEFKKYPCKIIARKDHIQNKMVRNPEIENYTFINKIFPLKNGNHIKILNKVNSDNKKDVLFECEFIEYPNIKILAYKGNILKGLVSSLELEENKEFIGKEFKQNCGDIIRVLEKTTEKNRDGKFFFKCEFIKFPYTLLAIKQDILIGRVDNPKLPFKEKELLKSYIKINFKTPPTLQKLSKELNISLSHICNCINKFELQNFVQKYFSLQEDTLRQYIKNILPSKCVSDKEIYIKDDGKEYGLDIFIQNKLLGFEYNGNYWHSELYKDQLYHQNKSLVFEKNNIHLIHIFEYEWIDEKKQNLLKYYIKSKLGIFDKKFFARKCVVEEISLEDYKSFCLKNHLQGYAFASKRFGLFFENELLQIISFSKPRFTDKYEWEIIRECSKLGYCIIGGKEKLWKYFIRNYNPKSVISYCDFSKFKGNSYLKLGFVKERLNKPGFVWWDSKNNIIFWRSPEKHQEFKEKYIKIWDAGQLVFVWTKT